MDPIRAAVLEQSGHIVMTDYATTGDGLMASLQAVLANPPAFPDGLGAKAQH